VRSSTDKRQGVHDAEQRDEDGHAEQAAELGLALGQLGCRASRCSALLVTVTSGKLASTASRAACAASALHAGRPAYQDLLHVLGAERGLEVRPQQQRVAADGRVVVEATTV
jgi:hypothetical protein